MTFYLAGLGTATPEHWITQEDAATMAVELATTRRHARSLPSLYRRSGVKQRHSVVLDSSSSGSPPRQHFYPVATSLEQRGPSTAERMQRFHEEATKLACEASRQALSAAAVELPAVTHLVTVSCTGFAAPGVDLHLIETLPLPRGVQRVHVGFMGCHGALNGLRVAHGMLAASPGARVLLCAVELCSLHQQYTDEPQQLVANSLFGDGAAALVLQLAEAPNIGWRLASQASLVLPDTSDLMSWRIGDAGFEMTLSPQVPDLLLRDLRGWVESWLAESNLRLEDIRHWAIHPGGPRILTAVEQALELREDQMAPSREILETCGNMSSPTVLFILQRIRQSAISGPCVLMAFGPGLTMEATLLLPASGQD